ncbi:MAG: hypothetical protein JW784_06155 [Candidatus Cloacimonetes bacterium]|nr:hypothetical protein [Candidatus Cloacimonadota bacterium]
MLILRCLAFLVFNLLTAFFIVFSIKAFLFYPRHSWFINGKRVIFTPGFLYRQKSRLFHGLDNLLNNYLRETASASDKTKIAEWEKKAYRRAWENLQGVENIRFLPHSIKEKIRYYLALVCYEAVRQFLRTFIPFLLERYQARRLITEMELRLDVAVLEDYYNRYIYRFMLVFFLGIAFCIGLGNMIIYIIIR